jgi:hypothetical protein
MSALRKHWAATAKKPQVQPVIRKDDRPEPAAAPKARVLKVERVYPGETVLRTLDVRSVISQLDLLGRFLSDLVSEERADALDVLLRSRTFQDGFAARARKARDLEATLLWRLAERPADAGYAPVQIEGVDEAEIAGAVLALWKRGLVTARLPHPIAKVVPGAVTTKGLRELKKVGRKGGA